MKPRNLAILLTTGLVVSLAACGSDSESDMVVAVCVDLGGGSRAVDLIDILVDDE